MAESKSTSVSPKRVQSRLKGLQSEQKVIDHLLKLSWSLEFQRAKTRVAEVDLVFRKSYDVRLIEVKTLDDPWRSFERISENQIQKLISNQLYFSSLLGKKFQMSCYVAWVGQKQIDFVRIN